MDSHAMVWDTWNSQGGPKYPDSHVVRFAFTQASKPYSNYKCLDLGCGSGVHTSFLAREGFCTYAQDISNVAITNCRELLQKENLPAKVRVASIDDLDYPESFFDLVICNAVFECASPEDVSVCLSKLPTIMAPSAKGLFYIAADDDFRFPEIASQLGMHGYSLDEIKKIFDGTFPYIAIDEFVTTRNNRQLVNRNWIITVSK